MSGSDRKRDSSSQHLVQILLHARLLHCHACHAGLQEQLAGSVYTVA
jgi:hypothetical protein